MKIAIIGGGFTGLSAAYYLTSEGHEVTIFEKESYLGGLAFGFKEKHWDWHLEYAYHHLFTTDTAILSLIQQIGLQKKVIIKRPITATLFKQKPYPLDSIFSLLSFPGLAIADRIRTGAFIAAMKFNPFWQPLENFSAAEIAKNLGGNAGWKTIWEPLLIGKFGTYAPDIAASWLWARIKKRTPSLAYIEGGFQTLINQLEKTIIKQGGTIRTSTMIEAITANNGTMKQSNKPFVITYGKKKESFDTVLLTLPTPLAIKMVPELLTTHNPQPTANTLHQSLTIPHLHAQVLILETRTPILNDIYWLNITDKSYPFLAVVAHTNYMDKKHYGGNHITYIGNYLPPNHPFVKLSKDQLLKKFTPYLKKLNQQFSNRTIEQSYVFTGPFAQPVHTRRYSQRAPLLQTPISGIFLANMDSIYPWDRGTNYAVDLGKKAAAAITKKNSVPSGR